MTNPWLALDVATNATLRARELRAARELFLDGEIAPFGVRAPIAASWQRSAEGGVDPTMRAAPVEVPADEAFELLREHPFGALAPLLSQSLGAVSRASDHLIAVSDADGLLLAVDGDDRIREEARARMGLVPGARFSETAAGTNAIGTSLAAGQAVQVFASEHFCEHSQWWTCAAAPIRDPTSGRLLGTVNLTAPMETVHPHSLALVAATATLLEMSLGQMRRRPDGTHDASDASQREPAEMRWSAPESHATSVSPGPHDAGGLRLAPARRDAPTIRPVELQRAETPAAPVLELNALGGDRADARLAGRPVHLSLRHSELLILLATHPNGMTAEELALQLYGDGGKPVTVRAELSRLRRILPSCVETDPYRLVSPARTDLAELQALLRAGRARDAAARYRGRVLPRSEAPGIVDIRDELEGWTRRAVMASDDIETLWSWLTTPSGEEDLPAWKRFLTNLPATDGRRGLAAARLERLRALLAVQ
jgi:hypothetical protein